MKNTVLRKKLKNNASKHVHLYENTDENMKNGFYNRLLNKLVHYCYSKCTILRHNIFYSSVSIK